MISPGTLAPDFTLPTDEGKPLTLSSLRGRPVVLFFYPKDDTPGWTVEACSFRDALPRFEGINAVVLGISADSVQSHAKFKKKYELPYTLLADTEHKVSDAYGVWGPKSIFGVKYDGISRTTFLIDEEGRVVRVFEKVKSAGHGDEVAAALAEMV
jgi:peroxiredoxin Q/BCP